MDSQSVTSGPCVLLNGCGPLVEKNYLFTFYESTDRQIVLQGWGLSKWPSSNWGYRSINDVML